MFKTGGGERKVDVGNGCVKMVGGGGVLLLCVGKGTGRVKVNT